MEPLVGVGGAKFSHLAGKKNMSLLLYSINLRLRTKLCKENETFLLTSKYFAVYFPFVFHVLHQMLPPALSKLALTENRDRASCKLLLGLHTVPTII